MNFVARIAGSRPSPLAGLAMLLIRGISIAGENDARVRLVHEITDHGAGSTPTIRAFHLRRTLREALAGPVFDCECR